MESTDIKLARIQEQMRIVLENQQISQVDRNIMEKDITAIAKLIDKLDHRLETIEIQVSHITPTLIEFRELKHSIQGARKFGTWLWVVIAGIAGFTVAIINIVKHFF